MKQSYVGAVHSALGSGIPVVGVRIVMHAGSAPRTTGAWMLVFPDGSISGTVGGGLAEAEAIKTASAMHDKLAVGGTPPPAIIHFSLAGENDMDMICGGSLSLLFEPLSPNAARRAVFKRAAGAERAGESFVLVSHLLFETRAYGGKDASGRMATMFFGESSGPLYEEGWEAVSWLGGNILPEGVALSIRQALVGNKPPSLSGKGEERWLLEPYRAPSALYLFGGGHVSLATAALACTVGFRTVVIEDRREFVNEERFPHSRSVLLPDMREDTLAEFMRKEAPGKMDAIVIMTRGHAYDREALAASLREADAGYLGMIGSRTKRDLVYASLREQGIPEDRISKVHCPVGLPILAQTPEEIAVSIVAELIRWRGSL